MTGTFFDLPKRLVVGGAAGGLLVAFLWLLSPLAVCAAVALTLIFAGALQGLSSRERMWVGALLTMALALRLLALVAFAASVRYDDFQLPILVSDERTFKMVSLWLRNIYFDVPIHEVFFQSAYASYRSSDAFVFLLAYLQILFGPSPYGFHFLNVACFFAAAVLLYRTARASYGRLPALGGFAALLFLPTVFVWSISALKEPLHVLLLAVLIFGTQRAARMTGWVPRVAAAGLTAGSVVALGFLRAGAMAGAIISLAAACLCVMLGTKGWRWAILVALLCGGGVAMWQNTALQARALRVMRLAAEKHLGHALTPGYAYKLLDDRFYFGSSSAAETMTLEEGGRFVVRAAASFLVVPAPWQAASRATLAYLPQQMVWYLLIVLACVGCAAGLRKDSLLTFLLLANIGFYAAGIALLNGNIGTLVRQRDLVMPMLVWLSAMGVETVVRWAVPHPHRTTGHRFPTVERLSAEARL